MTQQAVTPQVILVTGTNSGFGRLITLTLARKGHAVFATMRDIGTRNAAAAAEFQALNAAEGLRIHPIEVDLGSDASVNGAVERIQREVGAIDAVVNNAGAGFIGLEETLTPDQLEDLYRVNVIAPHRVSRAVLPSMRARGKGLLIHISSGLGRLVFPFMAAYCSSKAALESLFDGYRYELAPLGIDSVLVQPGAFPTDFGSRIRMGGDADRAAGYGPVADGLNGLMAGMQAMLTGPQAQNPQDVADAVLALVEAPAGGRPDRVVVDKISGQGVEILNATHRQIQEPALKMLSGGGGH